MSNYKVIPIIIPSYEPDGRLPDLIKSLSEYMLKNSYKDKGIEVPIILVNDGSGKEFDSVFDLAKNRDKCIVIRHYANLGKGRGLKDAFNYCLCRYPDMQGCVTADSDGQHTAKDIFRCLDALSEFPQSLILGARNFDGGMVPFKSRFGNKITKLVCRFLCGISVSDTQTGLRAIPRQFMSHLLHVKGERFEFETRMLLETRQKIEIHEIAVQTIYESKENHKTHFDPLTDSIRIYGIIFEEFIKFLAASVSSCVIDLWIFMILSDLLCKWSLHVPVSVIIARIISSVYNYFVNRTAVFHNRQAVSVSAGRYALLAAGIMLFSAAFAYFGTLVLPHAPKTAVKIFVDCILFVFSYRMQRKFVFKEKEK